MNPSIFQSSQGHLRGIAFGATMLASSMMNNVFVTYYLALFADVVNISPFWFYLGQSVFMLWNAVNDPLFGWISDKMHSSTRLGRRMNAIRWGGIGWALSFLLVWYPFYMYSRPSVSVTDENDNEAGMFSSAIAGFHFIIALCAYDGMLTYVEVNHGALLAEIAHTSSQRAVANMWSACCAAIGSLSSYAAHLLWDPEKLQRFQIMCWVIMVISILVFECSVRLLRRFDSPCQNLLDTNTHTSKMKCMHPAKEPTTEGMVAATEPKMVESIFSDYTQFIQQLAHHRNFVLFVGASVIQVFDCTFEKNFFASFLDTLTVPTVPANIRSIIVSASFMLPHACTILSTPLIRTYGLHFTLQSIFRLRFALLGGSALMSWYFGLYNGKPGSGAPFAIACFMLINRVLSEAVCRLFPLVVSDLIDEDRYLHHRPASMSASIVGTAAFASKFSQSLAPMLGFSLLSSGMPVNESDELKPNDEWATAWTQHRVWLLLLTIPLCCVVIQSLLWERFSLRGSYLKEVQTKIRSSDEMEPSTGSRLKSLDTMQSSENHTQQLQRRTISSHMNLNNGQEPLPQTEFYV